MRAVALLAFVALTSPAFAQAPTDRVKLDVSRAELQIIGQGLMELPYKNAAGVMNTLQQQLNANDQAVAAAAAKAAEEAKAKKAEDKPSEAAPPSEAKQ